MLEQKAREKFDRVRNRVSELEGLLTKPEILTDYTKMRDYNKELTRLKKMLLVYDQYHALEQQQHQTKALLKDEDEDLRKLAIQEHEDLTKQLNEKYDELAELLQEGNRIDERNVFMEIRPAAGGDESAIFAGDLLRMYQYYIEKKNWDLEIISLSPSEQGGYKLVVMAIKGENVFGHLKFESGTHRVQRVPKTEAQGRVHTSTCTIAVLPEAAGSDDLVINKKDLRIDTFRASGAGGQHVNKTDSAIRITHIPTGLVVECQEQRSQHRNKEKAMEFLRAQLLQREEEKRQAEETELRRSLVGRGDRAEKIRTYNFSQNRVTDHRLPITLYSLGDLMLGDLDIIINPLMTEERILAIKESAQ